MNVFDNAEVYAVETPSTSWAPCSPSWAGREQVHENMAPDQLDEDALGRIDELMS